MECPHLGASVSLAPDSAKFPQGSPSSWCCSVCRSNKSPWICLTCSSVHCGRYVNGHAKKHYEDAQVSLINHKKAEKQEKVQHLVCMDCSSYSTYCYRCDDFVVNDTKLGLVQKVREHLQNLENSGFTVDRHRKRKLLESASVNSKLLKVNGNPTSLCATGLRNLGNTCFMNAILQSLSNIPQFCCYFKELPAVELRNGKTAGRRTYHTRSQGDNSVSLVEEFRKTLCALWQGSQTAFSPESLFYVVWKIMPNFRGYQQQDAHEFMRYLLDHLHLELQEGFNGVAHPALVPESPGLTAGSRCCVNGTSTVVTTIFGGVLQNEVNCLICGTESRKFDPFLDLSLDIPSQFRNKRNKNQENGPICTVRDCLRSFTDLEELDDSELYMCHKCKKKQKSTKKFWMQKLPKVLCLHLKRFHWTAYLRNKVDTFVEFPLRGLDMKCYLLEPENSGPDSCLYDLAAVVVHHGSGHPRAMHLTELNWECLLHLFSFLDKNGRKNLAQTCRRLLWVFQDPSLWPLLHFHSPAELTKDNFVLGPALHHLSICWHSSQVKVCNVEDWMKNELQRNICSLHKHLVNEFLLQVSNRCPSLLSLKLSGCGHVTDHSIMLLLKSCPGLQTLQLENCVLITDQTLEAVALHANSLKTLHVDFCRNITAAGVQRVQKMCPSLTLSAERSANMIPDKRPGSWALERGLKRMLWH